MTIRISDLKSDYVIGYYVIEGLYPSVFLSKITHFNHQLLILIP
jgi:hypothetical protein